jgi:hypothetical protein
MQAMSRIMEMLARFDDEALRGFATARRQLARVLTAQAEATADGAENESLRTQAQLALYDAHEADVLFKLREREADAGRAC